jgi:hypothetical protein
VSEVKRPSIVTTAYRYKRPPRKQQAAAPLAGPAVVTKRATKPKAEPTAVTSPPPANDDRKPAAAQKPAIVTAASRKQLKLERAGKAQDDGYELSPEVKAFFARMIGPGGSLPPRKP